MSDLETAELAAKLQHAYFTAGGVLSATHGWYAVARVALGQQSPAPSEPPALKIGGRYNWKNQPERLVYVGLCEPRNGRWHQFAKVENPAAVWCEVLDSDLRMMEETPQSPAPSPEPVMPPSRGQSPVLFEDGYAEGWAKCAAAWRAALASPAPSDLRAALAELDQALPGRNVGSSVVMFPRLEQACAKVRAALAVSAAAHEPELADAARYRWLRDCFWPLDKVMFCNSSDGRTWRNGSDLDAAIDKARQAESAAVAPQSKKVAE